MNYGKFLDLLKNCRFF